MRIGVDGRYVRDSYPGIGRYTFHLLEALLDLDAGDEWWVLYDPAAKDSRFSIVPFERRGGVTMVPIRTPVRTWSEQLLLPRHLAGLHLHVFHTPFHLYPYLARVPTVSTVHDVIPLVHPSGFSAKSRWIFRAATQLAVWRSRRVIAVSRSTARSLQDRFLGAARRISVVPEGVDARFRPMAPQTVERIRSRHGLPAEYLLTVGIDSPHKNLRMLVEAYADLESAPPLVLAGPRDPRYTGTRQTVQELDLEGRVLFAGELPEEDLPSVYSGAALFLFPSMHEGFGLPVLEAMACGTPVVSSDASSLPELVGDAGLLVSPREPDAWTQEIANLLDDVAARQRMREKGLARAREFTWHRTAVETHKVYERAADGGTFSGTN